MNLDNIIERAKEIETILVDMGATGKGLHEKVSSLETNLNKSVVKAIRYIATIRNNALHDDNFKLTKDIIDEYEDAYEMVLLMLNIEIKKPKSSDREKKKKELSAFELNVIKKSKKGYVDPNDTTVRQDVYGDEVNWNYCPNCEEDCVNTKLKINIENNEYFVRYCFTCDYVFSSKIIIN